MFNKVVQAVTKHKWVILACIVLVIGVMSYFDMGVIEAFSNFNRQRKNNRLIDIYLAKTTWGSDEKGKKNVMDGVAFLRKDLKKKGIQEPDGNKVIRKVKRMRNFAENPLFKQNDEMRRVSWKTANDDQRMAIIFAEALIESGRAAQKKCRACAKLGDCEQVLKQKLD